MTEIKLDLTEAKRCSRLCELSINYNAGVPTAVFTKNSSEINLKFVYSRVERNHDVVFLKKKYILTEFTIHEKIHEKSGDVGEVIFIHKNVADMSDILAISVFVRKTEKNVVSMCQDFFTQLSDGILNINKSETTEKLNTYLNTYLETQNVFKQELVVNPYWSARSVIQSGNSFFFYKGNIPYASGISQDVTYIVLENLIDMRKDDFNVFLKFQHVSITKQINNLYYNSGIPIPTTKTTKIVNQSINERTCEDDELEYDIDKDTYKSPYDESQGRFSVFFFSLVGVIAVIFLFKIPFFSSIVNIIGLLVWAFVHFVYIWYARFYTVIVFAIAWFPLYLMSKITGAIYRGRTEPLMRTTEEFECENKERACDRVWCKMGTAMYHKDNSVFIIIAKIIAILYLFRFFTRKFGTLHVKKSFTMNDTVCRNELTLLGDSYSIDNCYKPVKLKSVIGDTVSRQNFKKNYNEQRKDNVSAINAVKFSLKKIHKDMTLDKNYIVTLENGKDSGVNACDMYNKMFGYVFPKTCGTESEKLIVVKDEE